jgi:hypothetical protein
VLEGPQAGAAIPLRRETVAAFIGPAPRGPADIPVAIRSVQEYLRRFGCHDRPSRLEKYLSQFFDNGGQLAIVVRVSRGERHNRVRLPCGEGELVLEALHPGPFEHLRASVDYDNLPADDREHFNLVIHRLDSVARPLVAEQEIYPGVSARPDSPDFVGHALLNSDLVRLEGDGSGLRPLRTVGSGAASTYVYADKPAADPEAPSDYDLIGSVADGTGLYALEQVPCVDLVCVVPPSAGASLGPVALFAAERYCSRRCAMLLLDPPYQWDTVGAAVAGQRVGGFTSPNAVTYFPRPSSGTALGAIAGALAAADAEGGVWSAAADALTMRCPAPLSQRLGPGEAHQLVRAGVNALSLGTPGHLRLGGLVTLGRAAGMPPEWHQLRYRRLAQFIMGGISRGTRWAAFHRDDAATAGEVRQQVSTFLESLREAGALAGACAAEAWFVRCVPAPGHAPLQLTVGFAMRRPREFLAFRLCHEPAESQLSELGREPEIALAS